MSRTRRRILIGFFVLLVLGGLAVRAGLELASAARDLRQAEDLLDDAATALAEGRLAEAQGTLRRARTLVLEANESLRATPELDLIGMLPVARENLRSLEDSLEVAVTVIHGGIRILDESEALQGPDGTLEVSLSDGTIPLAAVSAAQEQIAALSTQLVPVSRRGEPRFLLPPVRQLRESVHDEAAERAHQLEVLGRGLEMLRQMAGGEGPRRYLIAVANTAEMRGSGGMILNYGVLEGRAGKIDLVEFGRIDNLALSGPVDPALLPADYVARWDGFEALSRFRQANLAGDFTVIAPALEAMYTSARRLPVNGVIQVDPVGLAAILSAVGPVSVPEIGEVGSHNVVPLTLHDAYFLFPNVEDRSDVLGDVAEAAFTRLVDGDFPSLRPLAEALVAAVDGRHLLMHSSTSSVQTSIRAFGADGAYPPVDGPDAFALTVQNLSGNKLDYYLDTHLRLSGDRPAGELGALEAQVTLTNTAPADTADPRYIFGPGPDLTQAPGQLRSLVTLYLPVGTSLAGVSGDATLEGVSTGTEDGRPYASFIVDVPASEARAIGLTLQLAPRPPGDYSLTLVPAPRVRPTTVEVDIATADGPVEGQVALDRQWVLGTGREALPVPGPIFR